MSFARHVSLCMVAYLHVKHWMWVRTTHFLLQQDTPPPCPIVPSWCNRAKTSPALHLRRGKLHFKALRATGSVCARVHILFFPRQAHLLLLRLWCGIQLPYLDFCPPFLGGPGSYVFSAPVTATSSQTLKRYQGFHVTCSNSINPHSSPYPPTLELGFWKIIFLFLEVNKQVKQVKSLILS